MGCGPPRHKYKVLKAKHSSDELKTFWKEVGTLLIKKDGSGGVLYLHWLDGEYVIKPSDDSERDPSR